MIMERHIKQYLNSRKNCWAKNTLKSESARLNTLPLPLPQPKDLYLILQEKLSLYSLLTTWTRIISLIDWLISEEIISGPNEYKKFKEKNKRYFKNVYLKSIPTLSFETAVKRIECLPNPAVRNKALQLIYSGMRWSESFTLSPQGLIVGKGGKVRQVHSPLEAPFPYSYATFRRHLASIGLKPHDLRKLALNKIVEAGADPFQLAMIAGWNSIETARSYIQSNPDKLKKLVKRAFHG